MFFYGKLTCVLKLEVNATILDNDCFYFETKPNSSLKLMVDTVLINALDWFLYGAFFYWLYLTTTWGERQPPFRAFGKHALPNPLMEFVTESKAIVSPGNIQKYVWHGVSSTLQNIVFSLDPDTATLTYF